MHIKGWLNSSRVADVIYHTLIKYEKVMIKGLRLQKLQYLGYC